MSGLTIHIAGLAAGLSRLRLEVAAQDLGLKNSEWPEAVAADLSVERAGERLAIRGVVQAVAALECVRCLKPYRLSVAAPFELFAERSSHRGRHGDEEDLERDSYMMFHDGRELDIAGEAHDALLLEIPMTPHCREDCPGLCSRCGTDLNEGPCGCAVQA